MNKAHTVHGQHVLAHIRDRHTICIDVWVCGLAFALSVFATGSFSLYIYR
jgi:hypothetical protein